LEQTRKFVVEGSRRLWHAPTDLIFFFAWPTSTIHTAGMIMFFRDHDQK